MEQTKENNEIEELKEQIISYTELKTEMVKLSLVEKISLFTANFASVCIITLLLMSIIISLFLALAMYIGQLIHNYAQGFLISGACYLALLIMFIILFRKPMKSYITNTLINNFLNDGIEK